MADRRAELAKALQDGCELVVGTGLLAYQRARAAASEARAASAAARWCAALRAAVVTPATELVERARAEHRRRDTGR